MMLRPRFVALSKSIQGDYRQGVRCAWTNLASDPPYSGTVAALREQLPKDHAALVKTKPFDFRARSQKYHKEFRDKKLIERIKRD